MSDESNAVVAVERELATAAGGYLRNPIREAYVTCDVCRTPIDDQYTHCYPCNGVRVIRGIADLVVPLTYSIEGEQSGWLFRGYKDDMNVAARQHHSFIISRLLFLGIVRHQQCIERQLGQAVNLRLAIPSLSGRKGPHPFVELTTSMGVAPVKPVLVPGPGATNLRVFSADQFVLVPEVDLTGQHVLVVDDTWTKGSRTQSAALALRRYGAKYVSVLAVSRYLRPSYGNNAEFIKKRLQRDYDPNICPVTGSDCP